MKKLFIALFAVFMSFNMATAQGEGYVKMEFTDVSSDNEQMAASLQMMKNTQVEIYFKGDESLSSMNMMGGMVQVRNKTNVKTKEFNMLMDAMGQKFWVSTTMDEMQKMNPKNKTEEDVKITYDKSDTKKS